MKKKILSWLLILCTVFALMPSWAFAAEIVDSGKCGENLTYTLDSDGVLIISGKGAMWDYGWNSNAAPWRENVKKAVIQSGVTSIGVNAFSNCDQMTSITIPDSVTKISEGAFTGSDGLTSVQIPSGVTEIEQSSFAFCSNLRKVELPNGLKTIGLAAFGSCKNLTSITLPNTVTTIGWMAFNNCTNLKRISFPESVTTVAGGAFENCEGLTSIDLGMCEFDFNEVFSCWGSYDERQTLGKLETIQVSSNNKVYSVKDNVLYTKDGKTLVRRPAALTDAFSVPSDVTTIGMYAFGNSQASEINLLGSGVTTIAYGAFRGASNLKHVEFPDTVKSLDESVLRNCKSLETVVFPEGLSTIPRGTFYCNHAIKSIYIPQSVTSVGHIFLSPDGEASMTDIYFGGTEKQWNAIRVPEGQYSVYNEKTNTYDLKDYDIDVIFGLYTVHFNHTHVWDQGTVTKAAAVGVTGEKVYHCTECTKTKVEILDALPDSTPSPKPTTSPTPAPTTSFTDVAANAFYADAVEWAVNHKPYQITAGTGGGKFSPNAPCTRGQMVTFLWRAAGQPEPKTTSNPFTDVKSDAFYYKPVLWAVENGITYGTSATAFGPNDTVTRGQTVTFLWRFAKNPAVKGSNPFKDVSADAFYYNPVLWASENGVAYGTGNGLYSPNDPCTRSQIVTFLYRYMQK